MWRAGEISDLGPTATGILPVRGFYAYPRYAASVPSEEPLLMRWRITLKLACYCSHRRSSARVRRSASK
ncbi:hypothetical protein P3T40_008081 [Paraburkholderia sp. EB58]|jgi:hypothetical protein